MSFGEKSSFQYDNGDSTVCTRGCGLKRSSVPKVALGTANTDFPVGVALESCNRFDTLSVEMRSGAFVVALGSSSAITAGNKVTMSGTAGKFSPATKLSGTGIVVSAGEEYEWGLAWEATTNDLDLFSLLFRPMEVEQ